MADLREQPVLLTRAELRAEQEAELSARHTAELEEEAGIGRQDRIGAVITGWCADQASPLLSATEREVRERMRRDGIPVYGDD